MLVLYLLCVNARNQCTLIRANGRRLDIEVDGERYHRDWDGELVRRDQIRNLRLIEMGWDIIRFWVYEIRDSLPMCTDRLLRWVEASDELPAVGEVGTVDATIVGLEQTN